MEDINCNHDTQGEAGDDGVLDGDGSEGEVVDMAGEELGDGAERVLADGGEDGRGGEEPELLGLDQELGEERLSSCYTLDIIVSNQMKVPISFQLLISFPALKQMLPHKIIGPALH